MPIGTERKAINYRRRVKCLWPKLRKKLHKEYHRKVKDLGLLHYFDYYKKSCPICGATRRSGYIHSCPKCGWVIEYRNKIKELENIHISSDSWIVFHFRDYFATIVFSEVFPSSYVEIKDGARIKLSIASSTRHINLTSYKYSFNEFRDSFKEILEYLDTKTKEYIKNNDDYKRVIDKFPSLENYIFNRNDLGNPVKILYQQRK